jgi:hypothetical protein
MQNPGDKYSPQASCLMPPAPIEAGLNSLIFLLKLAISFRWKGSGSAVVQFATICDGRHTQGCLPILSMQFACHSKASRLPFCNFRLINLLTATCSTTQIDRKYEKADKCVFQY